MTIHMRKKLPVKTLYPRYFNKINHQQKQACSWVKVWFNLSKNTSTVQSQNSQNCEFSMNFGHPIKNTFLGI